jgi:hypothetical protein
MATKLEAPNAQELAWIADNLARATAMAKKYGGDEDTLDRPTLAGLDGLWSRWCAALRESDGDPNPLINMVGIALGQHLVDALGLEWVIATDDAGTELAVHGEPNDVMIYPCNLVGKRWQSRETVFVAAMGASLIRDVTAIRSASTS